MAGTLPKGTAILTDLNIERNIFHHLVSVYSLSCFFNSFHTKQLTLKQQSNPSHVYQKIPFFRK